MATDPVCGMFVAESPEAIQLTRENRRYYFCCSGCRDTFANPFEERRRLARRLAVAWPLSIAVVALSYVDPTRVSVGIAALLAGIVQGYAGAPFYRGAWDALRRRVGNMDFLIAVGTTAAFAYSAVALLVPGRLPSEYFFDASSLIVTLILTGSYLEHLTRVRAGSAVQRLAELLPTEAVVLGRDGERTVPVAEVGAGDRVRVSPGGRFPADGIVRAGRTYVDESLLTGEPGAVEKRPGATVLAGTVNGEGVVEVEVTRVGPDAFVGQVGALLGEAEMSRISIRRTADRIAAAFVPAVLGIAVAAAVFWRVAEGVDLTTSVLVFVTVTITACPCAFGLATPAAILVGTGRAAEDGILFRGPEAIERAARIDLLLTDKTGTLTDSEPSVSDLVALPPCTEPELIALVAGVSVGSEHPLGRAVARAAAARGIAPTPVEDTTALPGRGVRGHVGPEAVAILSGREAPAERIDVAPIAAWVRGVEARGDSWSIAVRNGRLVGAVAFGTSLVPGAREAVAALRAGGVDVAIVTGDGEPAARRVAAALGIARVHAGADPAAKLAVLAEYQRAGRVVGFVGDGVNDAPAIAAADAGFAIGSGTDVAREAGQVILVRPDFRTVPAAIGWARRTVARVRRNLYWAIGYNAVLIPVAAGALVPWLGLRAYAWLPIAGALAMGLSSATVVLNSLGLRRAVPADRSAGRPLRETVSSAPA